MSVKGEMQRAVMSAGDVLQYTERRWCSIVSMIQKKPQVKNQTEMVAHLLGVHADKNLWFLTVLLDPQSPPCTVFLSFFFTLSFFLAALHRHQAKENKQKNKKIKTRTGIFLSHYSTCWVFRVQLLFSVAKGRVQKKGGLTWRSGNIQHLAPKNK